ncbi:MAG: helix-turn-helix transcriptional regulator [Microcoleus sp. PH2017_40_RAT_O_B]|uniref:helix-turn-helix transcriptional regulator n=1 Tax=unclassified Microcoleus TaxID=2642155 RepID=UPI001D9CE13D|nr:MULTISPECIES: helix-turn-helix transcriptional regulator [unclassified Microcoleus]MCC3570225.1 helix-turn-helix transcriptional regulator [Microcoleus sp. PH2017_34_RAT_O_A]MCC3584156.1 helix-turn-helix transcriptional regulator [Microcoleus sp. PH2017_30_WIL_O_A]MCC3608504.1 helix-turn-helix transcriptional regulator [Microcoleus sp. PH2017_40_RAT_O_B]
MQHLTQNDFQIFSGCLQELYKTCSVEDFSSHLLAIVSKVISAVDYTYTTLSFENSKTTSLDYKPAPGFDRLDTVNFEKVAHQHFYENPLVGNYLRTRDNRAHKVSDFLNEQQLHRLEGLYGKVMQPRGIKDLIAVSLPLALAAKSASKLYSGQDDIIAITLLGDRIFTERDRYLFNLLHPHLVQAQQNMNQFTQIEQEWVEQRHTLEALGIISLNGDGQVQFMSERALHWLKQYFQDSHFSTKCLPDNLQRWVKYQLSLVTPSDEIPAPHLPLKLEQAGKQLIVRFLTEQPLERYLLLLEEEEFLTLSSVSLEFLGLTKRETEVLFEVTQGKTNPEIAATLSLSIGTVRKYLEHIYSKLGVQTRAEAVVSALKQLGKLR